MHRLSVSTCFGRMAGLVLVLALSACAGTPKQGHPVVDRAMARWDTLLSGDLHAAYGYLSPGIRSSVSSLQYQRRILQQKVAWTGAEYLGSECSEQSCNVQIELKFTLIGALPGVPKFDGVQEVTEKWVKVDGAWWFVPEL